MASNLNQAPSIIIHARCNRCGEMKPETELNGLNPFTDSKNEFAYCRSLVECNSDEAKAIISNLLNHLNLDLIQK